MLRSASGGFTTAAWAASAQDAAGLVDSTVPDLGLADSKVAPALRVSRAGSRAALAAPTAPARLVLRAGRVPVVDRVAASVVPYWSLGSISFGHFSS